MIQNIFCVASKTNRRASFPLFQSNVQDTVRGYEVGISKQRHVLFAIHSFFKINWVLCGSEGLDCDLRGDVKRDIAYLCGL